MRDWLKKLRCDQKMSQLDIAKQVSISPQYYSLIEKDERRPSPEIAKRIAEVLGFPKEWYKLLENQDTNNLR